MGYNQKSAKIQEEVRLKRLVRNGKACFIVKYRPLALALESSLAGCDEYYRRDYR